MVNYDTPWFNGGLMGFNGGLMGFNFNDIPSGKRLTVCDIETGYRNSGFTHEKW